MDENRASITALITAYCRAYHAMHDTPKIFDDFIAPQLFTAQEHITFDQNLAGTLQLYNPELAAKNPDPASALAWVMQNMNGPITLSRSRYAEDCLEQAVQQGVQQYVILGAGMDTFAYRRPDLLERLQVFEVDHPATQAMKRQRLAMLHREIPTGLHFIPADFTTDRLTEAFQRSPFDASKVSFFGWLGVTYYLTREAVFATLRAITELGPQGSTMVFDYMDADAFVPERAAIRVQRMQAVARMVGEPMQTGFDPIELAGDLHRLGLELLEDLAPSDIQARYFQGRQDNYRAFEHVHFVRAAVA
jgi:methyltransferase (TIGR00027 family)